MTVHRIVNFNPGPCALPLPALEQAQAELLDYQGTGMSVMEISHRSKEYQAIHDEAKELISKLLGLGDDWYVMFLGGGASSQFYMVPFNFLGEGRSADYVLTGTWSQKAIKEARLLGEARVAGSSEDDKFRYIPPVDSLDIDPNASYVHITSNNTIYGTEWQEIPEKLPAPMICDMSSDFMARRFPLDGLDMVYAGAQKNAGPAGVTIVLLRKSALERCRKDGVPTMVSYHTHAAKDSLFNTPPAFNIYMVRNVMRWAMDQGGLDVIEARNREKAKILYDFIDAHPEQIKPHARPDSRSMMNVTFRLQDEATEKRFVEEALAQGFGGLKGHRSVGGIRVSIYNAISVQNVEDLVAFMGDFLAKL